MKNEAKGTIDISEVETAINKIEHLTELLKEANSLADELASKELNITFSIGGE